MVAGAAPDLFGLVPLAKKLLQLAMQPEDRQGYCCCFSLVVLETDSRLVAFENLLAAVAVDEVAAVAEKVQDLPLLVGLPLLVEAPRIAVAAAAAVAVERLAAAVRLVLDVLSPIAPLLPRTVQDFW